MSTRVYNTSPPAHNKVRIVDLFAGIGGLRFGVIEGLKAANMNYEVVFTSEIKQSAVQVLKMNHPDELISGDITKIAASDVPPHDLLLAGFPCQSFSHSGSRKGFGDKTKGTLFFDVLRILKHHKPNKFILENVEGLVTHDRTPEMSKNEPGRTLATILDELSKAGYYVSWGVLEATQFGVPQSRRRIFITGSTTPIKPVSDSVTSLSKPLSSILQEVSQIGSQNPLHDFNSLLRSEFGEDLTSLEGKIFRDWRGGVRNIHSWNINLKGKTSLWERTLLECMSIESKSSRWAAQGAVRKGEAFPLTVKQIQSFVPLSQEKLKEMLDSLVARKYLRQDTPETYRISSGKLTFPVSHVLRRDGYSNTIVATDCDRLTVLENGELRRFTNIELSRLFGFPDSYKFPEDLSFRKRCDLLGNSVVIPVAKAVTENLYFQ